MKRRSSRVMDTRRDGRPSRAVADAAEVRAG